MDRIHIWILIAIVSKSVEAECPLECYCFHGDTYVDCSGKGLSDLPENINDEVTFLDISGNLLDKIPFGLRKYEKLEHLDLSYNSISSLDEHDLIKNLKLKKINLSYNKFSSWTDLDNKSFRNLTDLKTLILKRNAFPDIGSTENRYLISSSITNLSLANCSIQNFNFNILQGLENIETLDLSHNNITTLNANLKSGTLVTLDLTHTGLHKIYDAFSQLTALQTLKVPYNYQLKSFYGRSNSLVKIDATQCGLDTLPKGSFPKLKMLVMRENNLRSLPSKAFSSMEDIRYMDLSLNKIKDIDSEAFYGLKNIRDIDLSYNTIADIDPRTFNSNFRLTIIKLSYNYLKAVIKFDSESLVALYLSNCEITNFHKESLTMMPSLKVLDLSTNQIKSIPDNLEAASLELLDLNSCKISTINNNTFAAMPKLRQLSLRGNRLTSDVRPSFFFNINELYLSDNSWRCDCANSDFKDLYYWLTSGAVTTSIHDLVCQSPEHAQGYKWGVACYESWSSHPDKAWAYTIAILLLLVTFFCIMISVRKTFKKRANRELRERQQNIAEARERLLRMREQEREMRIEESANAPDPRELQSPPSYNEALSMPKLNESQGSLAGSQGSLNGNLKGGKKRRRRRRRAQSAEDVRRGHDSDTEHHDRFYVESDV